MGIKRKVKIGFGVIILPNLPRLYLVLTGQNVQKLLKKSETEKFADSDSLSKVKHFKLVVRTSICERLLCRWQNNDQKWSSNGHFKEWLEREL